MFETNEHAVATLVRINNDNDRIYEANHILLLLCYVLFTHYKRTCGCGINVAIQLGNYGIRRLRTR